MRVAVSSTVRYRWGDFIALPEDDRRELVDGRLEEIESPTKWHESMCGVVLGYLMAWARRRGGFRALSSSFRVRITDRQGAMPDVQLLSQATFDAAAPNGLEKGHPELAVEIVSPTSRAHDRLRKLDWYAQIGVPEYWLFDPETRSLTVHRLVGDIYQIAHHCEGRAVFRSSTFKGLKIPLSELWEVFPGR